MLLGSLNMPWHRIDEKNLVTCPCQRSSVHAGGSADVDDAGPSNKPLLEDALGPFELDEALARPSYETVALIELGAVVGEDPSVHVFLRGPIRHVPSLTAPTVSCSPITGPTKAADPIPTRSTPCEGASLEPHGVRHRVTLRRPAGR
jgi:hypothetical protein